jgi:DNA modification methylase
MSLGYIKAKTHGPEYSWHKYWSRKPANVISAYLNYLVPDRGLVVDPFCGSGVVLLESLKLGLDSIGIDVNPTARAISNFLIDPVDPDEFKKTCLNLLEKLEDLYGQNFRTINGNEIRYLIHHVNVKCEKCLAINTFQSDLHGKNGKRCGNCGNKLSFGLSNLISTQITDVICIDANYKVSTEELARQEKLSNAEVTLSKRFDKSLVNNRRTLTSSELGVASYFTPRNFGILTEFAEMAHSINDIKMRRAVLLVLTASSAQASRLIASRGSLKTGGQAWTIPGFWVPPIHLESNPFVHLNARVEKLYSALRYAKDSSLRNTSHQIIGTSAKVALAKLESEGKKADLIFLDPPYGDSVAFLEFSAIWNAFMDEDVTYSDDISVSDRIEDPMDDQRYLIELEEILRLSARLLKPKGKALLTFNNISLESWKGIINAFQKANLSPIEVNYQDPAVISSKSQKSIGGSYVGDFYVIFGKSTSKPKKFDELETDFKSYLTRVIDARGGRVQYPVLQRYALEYWLENDLRADEIHEIDHVIADTFTKNENLWCHENANSPKLLSDILLEEIRKSRKIDIGIDDEFLIQVKKVMSHYGTPSLYEIKSILESLFDQGKIEDSQLQFSFEIN